MTETTLTILNSPPPLEKFIEFRSNCGWGRLDLQTARKTINAGVANVTAYDDNKLVGFGRAVGDGAIYFYIQDLIVIEEYRGRNIGTSIVETWEKKCFTKIWAFLDVQIIILGRV